MYIIDEMTLIKHSAGGKREKPTPVPQEVESRYDPEEGATVVTWWTKYRAEAHLSVSDGLGVWHKTGSTQLQKFSSREYRYEHRVVLDNLDRSGYYVYRVAPTLAEGVTGQFYKP